MRQPAGVAATPVAILMIWVEEDAAKLVLMDKTRLYQLTLLFLNVSIMVG